jgi:hypothetical protein
MSMEDIMKALMQSSTGTQQQASGGSGLGGLLGGLLGGGQQSAGGDALSQAIGGLLGGGQQSGGSAVGQLLGGLEQIIGGQAGTGQPLSAATGTAPSTSDPVMVLLQPFVDKLAAKVGISPAIATVIVSIALKYLVQSHPSTPGASPLDLGSVMQSLASGSGIDQSTLQSSGMVNDVMQATGLNQQQAVKSLNTTFNVLGKSVKGAGVSGKATLKKKK